MSRMRVFYDTGFNLESQRQFCSRFVREVIFEATGVVLLVAIRYADLMSLCLGIFGIGFCVAGSQTGACAMTAGFYPTSSRVTGVSWALGVGRLGAITGSLVGALMMANALGLSSVFMLLIVPVTCAAIAIGTMGMHYARTTGYAKAIE